MNSYDEQQLSDLLRDVTVPPDLKSRLREIPERTLVEPQAVLQGNNERFHPDSQPRPHSKSRWQFMLAIAAVLMTALFLAWKNYPVDKDLSGSIANVKTNDSNNNDPQTDRNLNDSKNDSDSVIRMKSTLVQSEQKAIEQLQADIDLTLAQLEIHQLRRELSAVQTNDIDFGTKQLWDLETTSMIVALADQAVVDFGGAPESARINMVRVIKEYPDSLGAAIAQKFLNQQSN